MTIILVVEDSAVDRTLIGSLLAKEPNWRVEFAHDGLAATQWLAAKSKSELPDVILTDLQMPRMDGLGLVKFVRQKLSHIPVVLITSDGSEKCAVDALRAGATNYSPKSTLRANLARTVQQMIDMAAYMRYTHDTRQSPEPKQVAFVLENDSALIAPAIEHMQENLPGWSDQDRWQLAVAMDEALVNAMHHGNLEVDSKLRESENESDYYNTIRQRKGKSPFCHRRVRVEAELSDQYICVQISDDGHGFDQGCLGDPTSGQNVCSVSGRGLFLIRCFMDTVAHNAAGNQITMTKIRKPTND